MMAVMDLLRVNKRWKPSNVSYTWNTGQITSIVSLTYYICSCATDPSIGCMDTTDYTITEPELLQQI